MAAVSRGLACLAPRWCMVQKATPLMQVGSRCCSGVAWWEESTEGEGEKSGSRALEQVLKEFRIQKAAPDWLPLLPGGSFWVPPEEKKKAKAVSASAIEPATEGELFAMIVPMGWPAPTAVNEALKGTPSDASQS